MASDKRQRNNNFDTERMKHYMSLPAEQKLKHLDKLNRFFDNAMPEKSKQVSKELKKRGF